MKFIEQDTSHPTLEAWDGDTLRARWRYIDPAGRYWDYIGEEGVAIECTEIAGFKAIVHHKELKRKIAAASKTLSETLDKLVYLYEGRTFNQTFFDAEAEAHKVYVKAHEAAWREYVQSW